MNSIIELKKQVVKQKINFKEFCTQNNLVLNDNLALIFAPETSELLKELWRAEKNVVYEGKRHPKISYFKDWLKNQSSSDNFYLILPSISISSNFYETDKPILVAKNQIIFEILKHLEESYSKDLDSLALFSTVTKNGIFLEGYADFPCEENGLYDGYINDLFIIEHK